MTYNIAKAGFSFMSFGLIYFYRSA